MGRRRLSLRLLAVCLTLGIAVLPTSAAASGFQLVEQNASGLGNAFSGQAAGVKDASAIFFNPAALTNVKGWNLVVSVEPIDVGTTFSNDPTRTTRPSLGPLVFPVAEGNSGGDAGKWIPVPNGYVSGQLGDRLWVGAAVNVPFGLETEWDPAWVGRFHATRSKVQAVNVNPTLAYRVNDRLSLGIGADYQHLTADLNSVVAYGGISFAVAASLPPPIGTLAGAGILAQLGGASGLALEAPALISGSSNAWGWNAGALIRLNEQAQIGVTYRSKITHDVSGDVTFQGVTHFSEDGPLGVVGAGINAQFANGPVTTTIKLPDTFSVAGRWQQSDALELLADWTFTGWSSIKSLDIVRSGQGAAFTSAPLQFKNTWRAGLGANYKVNERWTVRLGTAYDKTPVQDQFRTPRLPDDDRVWIAGGLQWKVRDKVRVDAGYAHLFISDAPSGLPNQDNPPSSTPMGALSGTYQAKVDILGAQLTLAF